VKLSTGVEQGFRPAYSWCFEWASAPEIPQRLKPQHTAFIAALKRCSTRNQNLPNLNSHGTLRRSRSQKKWLRASGQEFQTDPLAIHALKPREVGGTIAG